MAIPGMVEATWSGERPSIPKLTFDHASSADVERHQLKVLRPRLEVVHLGERGGGVCKGGMGPHVFDRLAFEIDAPGVTQGCQIVAAASNRHERNPVLDRRIFQFNFLYVKNLN